MKGAVYSPSFYGLITWALAYALFAIDLLEWEAAGIFTHFLFTIQMLLFFISTVFFSNKFEHVSNVIGRSSGVKCPSTKTVLILHAVGFIGLGKFISDFSSNLPVGFFESLVSNASSIRALGAEMESIGTQISYFGWLAIGISVCYRKLNIWLVCLSLVQFLMNLIFIDRTRPVWILFTALLCYLWSRSNINGWKVLRSLAGIGILFIGLFVAIAVWSGKTGEGGFDNGVNPLLGSLYIYLTAGFSYFAHMINIEVSKDYIFPDRIFAPIWIVLSWFDFASPPPGQILDFYEIPYPTNVGTALEPFYRDGGFLFLIIGMFVYSFGFNALGIFFLKRNNAYAVYAWATLCFCNFIAFFTQKIGNTPVWLFLIIGFALSIAVKNPTKIGLQESD